MADQAMMQRVTGVVADILKGKGVSRRPGPEDKLVDAGLTSMDMVNLMLAIEAEFDIMIPPGDITPDNFQTVSSVTALVARVGETALA